jgi:hypothetical protein
VKKNLATLMKIPRSFNPTFFRSNFKNSFMQRNLVGWEKFIFKVTLN